MATPRLSSVESSYDAEAALTALGLVEAARVAGRGPRFVAAVLATYQTAAAALALSWTPPILAEQSVPDAPAAVVVPSSMVTPPADVVARLAKVESDSQFDRLVASLLQDAAREARAVDIAVRSDVEGHVRSLRLPSCSRCVVLAGRVYRWSDGFLRHPLCDCVMTPVSSATASELVTDPTDAIRDGLVTGLSRNDLAAIDAGADLALVVNTRRRAAGITYAGLSAARGRLTVAECVRAAGEDRAGVVEILRANGYVR